MVELPSLHAECDLLVRRRSSFPGLEAAFHELAIGAGRHPTEDESPVFGREFREMPSGKSPILASHLRLVEEITSREALTNEPHVAGRVI